MDISGPKLPYYVIYIRQAMVKSPDGGGVMIIGGNTGFNFQSPKILELRAGGSSWQERAQKLDNGRDKHVVIPNLETCQ